MGNVQPGGQGNNNLGPPRNLQKGMWWPGNPGKPRPVQEKGTRKWDLPWVVLAPSESKDGVTGTAAI